MSVLTAYERFRFLWGAVDWESGSDSPYTSAQTGASLGPSAAPGAGVGVRRAVLHFDRTGQVVGADDAEMHFDFLNVTGGDPDDTWTSADYTTVEGFLDTWFDTVKPFVHNGCKLAGYHWYRHGPGVGTPNPAERVTSRSVFGTSTFLQIAPQVASSLTFRTAVRRSWGRTYLPGVPQNDFTTAGRLTTGYVDAMVGAADTLLQSAVGADFPLVVTSVKLSAVLNVEQVAMDDDSDIIRRRRWKTIGYRKVLP